MASVTLGQHPGQHHLEPDKLFFRKLANEGKKLMRKPSREKMTRERATAAAAAAPRVPLNQRPSSDPVSGTSALEMSCDSSDAEPPRSTDRTADADRAPAAQCALGCARNDAAEAQTRSGTDAQNANANNNGIVRSHPQRSSAKYISEMSPRAGGKARVKFRSLSADGDALEGIQLERLTQGRRGVVKLMRTEQPRRQAWSIFDQDESKKEKGEGHLFAPCRVKQDWCDACNRLIKSTARRCEYCSYTCHLECENHVQLDCNQGNGRKEEAPTDSPGRAYSTAPPAKSSTKEDEEEKQQSLSEEEVKAKIEEYNSKVSDNLMKLAADGTYTGFIRVHLRLRRPVTLREAQDGNSSGNSENSSAVPDISDKRASFYLPSEVVKQIHVSSSTTVKEVIEGLLRKFMVQDNPLKFALYKQVHRHGQDLFQKLQDSEHPLALRLLAGPDLEKLSFVLKENETGEVEWHAFSVPELQNFLAILKKEENERLKQVHQRYTAYREKLEQALQEVQNKPG